MGIQTFKIISSSPWEKHNPGVRGQIVKWWDIGRYMTECGGALTLAWEGMYVCGLGGVWAGSRCQGRVPQQGRGELRCEGQVGVKLGGRWEGNQREGMWCTESQSHYFPCLQDGEVGGNGHDNISWRGDRDQMRKGFECRTKGWDSDLKAKETYRLGLGCGERWVWRCQWVQSTADDRDVKICLWIIACDCYQLP